MASTRDKKKNGPAAIALSRPVPQTKTKQPTPATNVATPVVTSQLPAAIAATAADKKTRADAGTPQRSKATDKSVPPSAHGRYHGGGSTSTTTPSPGTTGPKDKATSSPVPEVKPKKNKEKSKNQN